MKYCVTQYIHIQDVQSMVELQGTISFRSDLFLRDALLFPWSTGLHLDPHPHPQNLLTNVCRNSVRDKEQHNGVQRSIFSVYVLSGSIFAVLRDEKRRVVMSYRWSNSWKHRGERERKEQEDSHLCSSLAEFESRDSSWRISTPRSR